MSAKATFWAWSQTGLKSSQKLTLLCLADNHNASTGQCNPSVAFIADKTGLNRKTILGALAELEAVGLLLPEKTYGASTNFTLQTETDAGTNPKAKPPQTGTKNGTGPENGPRETPVPKAGPVPPTEPVPKTGPVPVPKTGPVPNTEPVPKLPPTGTNFTYNRYQNWDTESTRESTRESKERDVRASARARERFPMSLDWVPDPATWQANASRAGIRPDYESVIHEFRMFWSGDGRTFTESQWQAKLMNRIRQGYQRTQFVKNDSEPLSTPEGREEIYRKYASDYSDSGGAT